MQNGSALGETQWNVSMESGLEDRNNTSPYPQARKTPPTVSMESGLEDRNN